MRNASGLRQMVPDVGFPALLARPAVAQRDVGPARISRDARAELCQPASADGIAPIQARRIDSVENYVK
jgi:hypothetical protein